MNCERPTSALASVLRVSIAILLSFLFSSLLFSLLVFSAATAQDADEEEPVSNFPETEIFLFEIDLESSDAPLSGGVNVTNRAGYDNQPYFTPDGASFVYSRDDGQQTDVYEYFIESGEIKRLTESEATEFSPTPFPDNSSIAFVSDRSSSIWHAGRDDMNNPKVAQTAFNNTEPIGYFAWNHATGDILYWSQFGFSISLVHESEAKYHFVTGHAVPSTPHVIPNTNKFSFVHRQTNEQVWIKELDPDSKAIRPLVPLLGSNANYVWSEDGKIVLIENNSLHIYDPNTDQGWEQLADFADFGISQAYRLAISDRHLAVVGQVAN